MTGDAPNYDLPDEDREALEAVGRRHGRDSIPDARSARELLDHMWQESGLKPLCVRCVREPQEDDELCAFCTVIAEGQL